MSNGQSSNEKQRCSARLFALLSWGRLPTAGTSGACKLTSHMKVANEYCYRSSITKSGKWWLVHPRHVLALSTFLLLLTCSPVSCEDIFSSTAHIKSLMYLERHLVGSLTNYLANVEDSIQHVKSYLSEFAFTAGRPQLAGTYAEDLMDNPLQAFQMLKRLTINLNKIEKAMSKHGWTQIGQIVQDYQSIWPSQKDLNGAALALIRLQDTYNLSRTDLARGNIHGQSTFVEMTARDCLYLGKSAFNNGYYGHSLDWFEEALFRASREGNRTATVEEITPFYRMAAHHHDKVETQLREANYTQRSDKLRLVEGDNVEYAKYQQLCRGETISQTRHNHRERVCHYSTNNGHPLLVIQPAKVEIVNRQPDVVLFHEIVTNTQIDFIKQLSTPSLTRARVVAQDEKGEVSQVRTSQVAWLTESSHPTIAKIAARIEAVTGLSSNTDQSNCESYQVANYGMGGHFIPHTDYLFKDLSEEERNQTIPQIDLKIGDRMATFMIYLTNVVSGGSTVFTHLDLNIKPVKGAAVFWYNLKRNGEIITDSMHAACPVLMGEKWVTNFWFRENGQMFRRPCTLDPLE